VRITDTPYKKLGDENVVSARQIYAIEFVRSLQSVWASFPGVSLPHTMNGCFMAMISGGPVAGSGRKPTGSKTAQTSQPMCAT
jgi:hypothetical protein